uniref:ATP synthase F0 subunit 8 n=1 Tax=Plotocnide borealis TaxID=1755686 RepID=A0A0S2IBS7_9CNID|nr:ATP synthase F0 subunit 8 [Plotocnide borealis]
MSQLDLSIFFYQFSSIIFVFFLFSHFLFLIINKYFYNKNLRLDYKSYISDNNKSLNSYSINFFLF